MKTDLFVVERVPVRIGTMLVVTAGDTLRALDWDDCEARMTRLLTRHYGLGYTLVSGRISPRVRRALRRYFDGDLDALADVQVATGGTAFQRRVWSALRDIPAGTTTTYGALARTIGSPNAVRAVGLANGANPIGIVVPCHRVIGASGALTGYAGGIARKRWLLSHERALA